MNGIPRFKQPGPVQIGKKNPVTVIGLGNILFSDEGVGVYTAAELSRRFTFSPEIDIIDGGTMGLDLLPFFQERDRILIIDAVDFRKEPGHMACLHQGAIRSVLNPKLSVHHIGLADLLLAAHLTRTQPLDLRLVGVQPCSLALGIGMTNVIERSVEALLETAINRLEEWNVTASRTDLPKDNELHIEISVLTPPTLQNNGLHPRFSKAL